MRKKTLPKIVRICRKPEIDLIYRTGQRLRSPLLRLHVKRNDQGQARLAISVPRRLCNAVKRNRWKRLLRESFRELREELPALDLLIIPNRPPTDLKRQDVQTALEKLLQQAGKPRR